MASKNELEIQSALINTGLVQPINCKSRGKFLEVLCRQTVGQEQAWLTAVKSLLELADKNDFEFHVCRRYVLKNKKLAFGWNLGIQSKNAKQMSDVIEAISLVLEKAKPSINEYQTHATTTPKEASKAASTFQRPLPAGKHPAPKPAGPRKTSQGEPSRFLDSSKFKVEKDTVDEKTGDKITVLEMPLPHVVRDLNKPNAKGRGANYT